MTLGGIAGLKDLQKAFRASSQCLTTMSCSATVMKCVLWVCSYKVQTNNLII